MGNGAISLEELETVSRYGFPLGVAPFSRVEGSLVDFRDLEVKKWWF